MILCQTGQNALKLKQTNTTNRTSPDETMEVDAKDQKK